MKAHVAEAVRAELVKVKRDLKDCKAGMRGANATVAKLLDQVAKLRTKSALKKPASKSKRPAPKKAKRSADKLLKGLSFVFTGKMSYYPRAEAQKMARKAGAKTPSTVRQGVDYLVVGDEGSPNYDGAGRKFARANELGVKILSEGRFLQMLGIKAGKF